MSCANGRTGSDPQLQTKARASRVTMLMMISAFDIPVNVANSCATISTKKNNTVRSTRNAISIPSYQFQGGL